MPFFSELIDDAANAFTRHLQLPGNEKILFSGMFGKGKTTFIKSYFEKQHQYLHTNKFQPIYLDPIHYSVTSNEDIFLHIKYDILLQLLANQTTIDSNHFSHLEKVPYYILHHPKELIKSILSFIPKIGQTISPHIETLDKLYHNFLDYAKTIDEQSDDVKATTFLTKIESNPYSIYENDLITQLIRNIISNENEHAEQILVIDNIDRIDPEHIFRILNVFSSQIDYKIHDTIINKFLFKKVIIVCDYENIRNIYRNKYGQDVDFAGYISKFYSIQVFYFDNYNHLKKICHKIIKSLRIQLESQQEELSFAYFSSSFGIYNLTTQMVFHNFLSLRQLLDYSKSVTRILDYDINNVETKANPLVEMTILSNLVGSYKELCRIIEKLAELNVIVYDYEIHFKQLLYFEYLSINSSVIQDKKVQWEYNSDTVFLYPLGNGRNFNITTPNQMHGGEEHPYTILPNDYLALYKKILTIFYSKKQIH